MNPAPVIAPGAHVHTADPLVLYRHGMRVDAREPRLRQVLLDALAHPGALTRLRLGLLAGEVLGLAAAPTRAFATALEYFHTASLLFDDLPSMDDAEERRGQPCAHRVHGVPATMLGALAFINRGYALLWEAFAAVPPAQRVAAAAQAERCLGDAGILDGQSLDLHFAGTDRTPRAVGRAALGKTVSLLQLTLLTPAMLVAASRREKLLLNRLSIYWGLAYQAADDCTDVAPVSGRPAKTAGRDRVRNRPNLAHAAGLEATTVRIERLLMLVRETWGGLIALRPGWHALAPMIVQLNQAALAAADALARQDATADRRCA
jgi:geranylgeranyl pyrophosphate synthase